MVNSEGMLFDLWSSCFGISSLIVRVYYRAQSGNDRILSGTFVIYLRDRSGLCPASVAIETHKNKGLRGLQQQLPCSFSSFQIAMRLLCFGQRIRFVYSNF
jgi:hypothetical protein